MYLGMRIVKIRHEDNEILWVESDAGDILYSESFIDATGSSGLKGCAGAMEMDAHRVYSAARHSGLGKCGKTVGLA